MTQQLRTQNINRKHQQHCLQKQYILSASRMMVTGSTSSSSSWIKNSLPGMIVSQVKSIDSFRDFLTVVTSKHGLSSNHEAAD